ncbi:hypothetical protein ACQRIU_002268 [Beauveria bassiana]
MAPIQNEFTIPYLEQFRPERPKKDVHTGIVFNDELDERLAFMKLVQQHLDKVKMNAKEGLQKDENDGCFLSADGDTKPTKRKT